MEEELKQMKSVLRSLVVSSPCQVDVRTLLRDYRNMVGSQIPLLKFGYKDPITFLKEMFSDCFLFQGPATNPVLTLIVPDALKHVDKFVQKQKKSSAVKLKGKRQSVPESIVTPRPDLIANTSAKKQDASVMKQNIVEKKDINIQNIEHGPTSNIALQNFLKRRTAQWKEENSERGGFNFSKNPYKQDDDSGRQTSSSTTSSSKIEQLEDLKREIRDLIHEHPEGVWCTDLLRTYRQRYGRELNFSHFGYTSVLSLAYTVNDVSVSRDDGDWLLQDAHGTTPLRAAPPQPAPRHRLAASSSQLELHPDGALPGVAFDPDVFPEDCMHFLESIPSSSMAGIGIGAMLEVAVAEVYSPSHFWLLRLGDEYNIAMENMMDEMNQYYSTAEGRERLLAPGAVRVGHYCSSRYEGDWHRSIIVKIIDSDTVKVRHVDYGTVERCDVRGLRALRREWGAMQAQAVRARLAGVQPPAAGRRWPHAVAHGFLRLVRDKPLIAKVVAIDLQDDALEVFLIDTSTESDMCLSSELIRSGHADPRPGSALGTSECYLYPRFEALERGDTPTFGEIHAYLRDGIALEFVDDYRRHVPPCLPTAPVAPEMTDGRESLARPPIDRAPFLCPDGAPLSSSSPRPPRLPLEPRAGLALRQSPTFSFTTQPPHCAYRASMPFARETLLSPRPSYHLAPSAPKSTFVLDTHRLPPVRPALSTVDRSRGVSLSAADCEAFALLSRVDPGAAHRFMLETVSRALAAPPSALDPNAPEFVVASAQTRDVTPPPGFRNDRPARYR